MKAIIEDNLNLTTIKCHRIQQEWELDDQVFNRLQTLCLMNCQRVVLYNFNRRQSPSNLKILCVDIQSIVNLGSLDMMLPKLNQLTFLKLTLPYNGQLEHETLCATPSPHLEQLIVWGKHTIRLRELDLKWPYLQKLYLDKCWRIEESQWSQCQFKGLVELYVPHKALKLQAIRRLRRMGVRINP